MHIPIHYGKKMTHVVEGLAADFCPICRRATGVEVRQVRMQEQINNFNVGNQKTVGRMCYCRECKSQWSFRAGTISSVLNPVSAVSLNTLLSETCPTFGVVKGSRVQLESVIRQDPALLDAQTRLKLIAEPFLVLENDIVQRADTLDARSRVILAIGFLAVLGFSVSSTQSFLSGDNVWGTGLLAMAVGAAYSLYSVFARFNVSAMRSNIYPRLAQCLAPLNPSQAELKTVMSSMKCRCAKDTRLVEFLPLLREERMKFEIAHRTGS